MRRIRGTFIHIRCEASRCRLTTTQPAGTPDGITLYFSNQLMPPAENLQAILFRDGAVGEGLYPPVVILPNINLSKRIKPALAGKSGIFTNVNFEYLASGLMNVAAVGCSISRNFISMSNAYSCAWNPSYRATGTTGCPMRSSKR